MNDVPDAALQEFLSACHDAARRDLMRCSSGNLSLRLDGERMLATASRCWMERAGPDDVAVCRIEDGARLAGPKPTVEIGFHAGILRTRPDVNVVLHFQSPCATAVACMETGTRDVSVIPEIPFYIGPVARVPYRVPGTEDLAGAVTEALREHDLAVLTNHGLVAVSDTLDGVIQNAVFFELACRIRVLGGRQVQPLSESAAGHLMALRQGGA